MISCAVFFVGLVIFRPKIFRGRIISWGNFFLGPEFSWAGIRGAIFPGGDFSAFFIAIDSSYRKTND